jgi:hypothetical protein
MDTAMRHTSKVLEVNVSSPQAGWLDIELQTPACALLIQASYTPNDFLQELLTALSLSLIGSEGVAVASAEPNVFKFVFSPADRPDLLSLQVIEYPHRKGPRGQGRTSLSIEGTKDSVVVPFWRALRSLQGRVSAEDFRSAMRREFPYATLERVSKQLGKERRRG